MPAGEKNKLYFPSLNKRSILVSSNINLYNFIKKLKWDDIGIGMRLDVDLCDILLILIVGPTKMR